ncbi:hypothetical protein EV363DRAFT_1173604 [Boletus edulis]|uniref:Uncharacterized protein n=1 Tax=Boletus edulis BED1 TaxID=1328754 RepID=A0AAD4BDJ1_BOLED|nr:hypothetical protein EV363DRAFT_1173604 [Boletus edulis]KAF8420299.1 hypothetical protein L210DRAFT_2257802 [Boletus edulis BED1]
MVANGVAMILHVYVMYSRSRIILGVLLVLYVAEIVILFIATSIYSDLKYVASTCRECRPIHVVLDEALTTVNYCSISRFALLPVCWVHRRGPTRPRLCSAFLTLSCVSLWWPTS